MFQAWYVVQGGPIGGMTIMANGRAATVAVSLKTWETRSQRSPGSRRIPRSPLEMEKEGLQSDDPK